MTREQFEQAVLAGAIKDRDVLMKMLDLGGRKS